MSTWGDSSGIRTNKIKTHTSSRETFSFVMVAVKLKIGLIRTLAKGSFFFITQHFGYEFYKYFTAPTWLIWDQGEQNNLQDVILDELHCIVSKKCPCLFCFYKFFTPLGRYGKILEFKSFVQWPHTRWN